MQELIFHHTDYAIFIYASHTSKGIAIWHEELDCLWRHGIGVGFNCQDFIRDGIWEIDFKFFHFLSLNSIIISGIVNFSFILFLLLKFDSD